MARPVTSLPTASAQLPSGSAAASAGAFYSPNTAPPRAVSEGAVPLSSHVDASSRSYSLEEARRVVRQPNRSDAEIQAACFVLKTQGNWQDDWIVCQIELAMQPNPLEV